MNQATLSRGSLRVAAATLAAAVGLLLAGCGQKGALYLPEASGEVITRPTQTAEPSATSAPAAAPTTTETSPSDNKKPATAPATPPVTP